MQASYHVYAIRDANGSIDFATVNNPGDLIALQACDTDGRARLFEGEAYHAELWALKHGFEYRHVEQFFDVETLF